MRSLLLIAGALTCSLGAYAGDVKAGREKAYTCTGCHGVVGYKNAYPSYHVPKIAGQNEVYLVNALTAYRAGERQHPTMQAQGESMTDQDIADIAAYLSQTSEESK
jgi:cytochrome c553